MKMISVVKMLFINMKLMMMSGKIEEGLSPGSNGNCKYLLKLLTVLDFPEAKVECFNKFVISPANQSGKILKIG